MSDELASTETPQAGETQDAPAASAEPTTERTFSAAEFRAVQNEAKNLRARLREIEGAAKGHQDAVATTRAELEATQARYAAAAEELRTHRLRSAVAAVAREDEALRGVDPDLVLPHLKIEWADDGTPKGVAAALKDVAKRFPSIVPSAAPGPRVPTQSAASNAQPAAAPDLVAQKRRLYPTL